MPREGLVDKIRIYQTANGKWREMFLGRPKYGSRYGILATRNFFGTDSTSNATQSVSLAPREIVKSRQRTNEVDKALLGGFRALKFLNNPNLYSGGRIIGGNAGLAMAVASGVAQTLKTTANISANIADAMTGETKRINNAKNLLNAVLDPMGTAIDMTFGGWLDNMRVRRENYGLEYQRRLTGQIVNAKDKGNY